MEQANLSSSAQYKLIHPLKHFRDFLENNIRQDGRNFSKYRPIGVNVGTFTYCNGSSVVKVGNSNVVCGIRAELTKPRVATPNAGYCIPNVDATFISNISNEQVDVLNCLLNDILHDSECINLKDLCISEKKLVWVLYMDVVCLEQDGSLLDAMVLACISALQNLTIPKVIFEEKSGKVIINNDKHEQTKLHLHGMPVISKFCIFDNLLLMDPTHDEESISSSSILCGLSNGNITFLHKRGGEDPITKGKIEESLIHATKREQKVVDLIKKLEV